VTSSFQLEVRSIRLHFRPMAIGKRKGPRSQASLWVATPDLPRSAAQPFYTRLNQILDQHDFDGYVEGLCQRFYADHGRPGLPPGRYFRLLLIGYFEGLDAERAIAWRAADSFALRQFLGLVLPEAPDHSTISRTRRLIDLEKHEAVFTWMLPRLANAGLSKAKPSASTRRRWKRMPPCAASCGATPARAIKAS
jgi:transposase